MIPTDRQRWLSAAETQAAMPAMQTIRPNTMATAGTNRHDDEAPALEADQGRYLGFVRLVARRRP